LRASWSATWENYWLTGKEVFMDCNKDFIDSTCIRSLFNVGDCLVNHLCFFRIMFEDFRKVHKLTKKMYFNRFKRACGMNTCATSTQNAIVTTSTGKYIELDK
jgi:hypothetical protein